jgi:DNA-binding transcriptional ArsR family regulator
MSDGPCIARVAALLGDPARAEVLSALMTGRALTATELANVAGVGKATMSAHLSKLSQARLLAMSRQGRHRYFSLADADVAELLESLMGVAFRIGAVRLVESPREPALRRARVCYDHLAGELGVRCYEALLHERRIAQTPTGLRLTPAGIAWCETAGIELPVRGRRAICRSCMDWSERRSHLAGALGAALLARIYEHGWARRLRESRVLRFSATGERALLAAVGAR